MNSHACMLLHNWMPDHTLSNIQCLHQGEHRGTCPPSHSIPSIISNKRSKCSKFNRAVTYPNKTVIFPNRICNYVHAELLVAAWFWNWQNFFHREILRPPNNTELFVYIQILPTKLSPYSMAYMLLLYSYLLQKVNNSYRM